MREQIDMFVKQQIRTVRRHVDAQVGEAQAANIILKGCLQRVKEQSFSIQPAIAKVKVKAKSSRALLRAIENAANETRFGSITNGLVCAPVTTKLPSQLMREHVNAFLKQKICAAQHRIQEAYASQHTLYSCLQRASREYQRKTNCFERRICTHGAARAK